MIKITTDNVLRDVKIDNEGFYFIGLDGLPYYLWEFIESFPALKTLGWPYTINKENVILKFTAATDGHIQVIFGEYLLQGDINDW